MNKPSGKVDVGLDKCKTEVAHANVHKLLWLLHLQKACLLIKNDFVKYFPCTFVFAQVSRWSVKRAPKTWSLMPIFKTFILISLKNYLLRAFLGMLAVPNAEGCFNAFSIRVENGCISFLFHSFTIFTHSSLKSFVHNTQFLIGFQSVGWQTWSTLIINQVGCRKRKSKHLLCVLSYPEL